MNLVLAGLLMCTAGGALIFAGFEDVPLWIAWLLGPTLWYLGFVFTCAGLIRIVMNAAHGKQRSTVHVVVPQKEAARGMAPMGLQREVPPMGGFLL
jgi:hypothetical protein